VWQYEDAPPHAEAPTVSVLLDIKEREVGPAGHHRVMAPQPKHGSEKTGMCRSYRMAEAVLLLLLCWTLMME